MHLKLGNLHLGREAVSSVEVRDDDLHSRQLGATEIDEMVGEH